MLCMVNVVSHIDWMVVFCNGVTRMLYNVTCLLVFFTHSGYVCNYHQPPMPVFLPWQPVTKSPICVDVTLNTDQTNIQTQDQGRYG